MTLLSIDPGRSYKGEKTIGWSLFDRLGREIERGRMSWEDLVVWLNIGGEYRLWFEPHEMGEYLIDMVIVENFVNNAKSRGGQTNGTSEVIGAIEMLCAKSRTPFVRRPPAALGPAKLHAPEGSFEPLAHLRHEDSAFLHGHEYLIETGVLTVPGISSTI